MSSADSVPSSSAILCYHDVVPSSADMIPSLSAIPCFHFSDCCVCAMCCLLCASVLLGHSPLSRLLFECHVSLPLFVCSDCFVVLFLVPIVLFLYSFVSSSLVVEEMVVEKMVVEKTVLL